MNFNTIQMQGLFAVMFGLVFGADPLRNSFLNELSTYANVLQTLTQQIRDLYQDNITELSSGNVNQWLIAAAINYNGTHIQLVNQTPEFYKNLKWSQFMSSNDFCTSCLNEAQNPPTKHVSKLANGITYHTEEQLLYGYRGRRLLDAAAQEGNMLLIYTYYIPCSQKGGTFSECSGDLAHYQCKVGRPGMIVVYEEIYYTTNECVSRLYHTQAGIPLFLYDPNEEKIDLTNPRYREYTDGIKFYKAPVVSLEATASKAELLAMCLVSSGALVHSIKIDRRASEKQAEHIMSLLIAAVLFHNNAVLSDTYAEVKILLSKLFSGNRNENAGNALDFCDQYVMCQDPNNKRSDTPKKIPQRWCQNNKLNELKGILNRNQVKYEDILIYVRGCLTSDEPNYLNPRANRLTAECNIKQNKMSSLCQGQ